MTGPAAPKLAKILRLARLRLKGAMALDVTSLNVFALCRCLRHAGKIMVLVVIGKRGRGSCRVALAACCYCLSARRAQAPRSAAAR